MAALWLQLLAPDWIWAAPWRCSVIVAVLYIGCKYVNALHCACTWTTLGLDRDDIALPRGCTVAAMADGVLDMDFTV